MNKSEYKKNKENKRVLFTYVVFAILLISLFVFAGKVQDKCIEANNVTLCD